VRALQGGGRHKARFLSARITNNNVSSLLSLSEHSPCFFSLHDPAWSMGFSASSRAVIIGSVYAKRWTRCRMRLGAAAETTFCRVSRYRPSSKLRYMATGTMQSDGRIRNWRRAMQAIWMYLPVPSCASARQASNCR
jgi:hypothetical protein